jgi:cytochrome c oxidase assembly protein subunit 15
MNMDNSSSSRRFLIALRILLGLIVGLMALGAGVRAMNAGLSCPDWPLCFGKVIPDFHLGVWFEFVHRAYAGIVTIVFAGCCYYVFRSRQISSGVKNAARFAILMLICQIIMGGLTVILLVKSVIVTSHLMLATLFFCAVLTMYFRTHPNVEQGSAPTPRGFVLATGTLAAAVFVQIFLGGFVASTYAGSVCVDWPLCNGQWVPTWTGAIGLQIFHRFFAYALALSFLSYAIILQRWSAGEGSQKPWMTPQLVRLSRWSAAVVFLQVVIGIMNLLYYIPAPVTVAHQSVAIILLGLSLRTYFVAKACAQATPGLRMANRISNSTQIAGGVSG